MFGLDPTTTTFLIYIIVMISIGFIAYRFTNNLSGRAEFRQFCNGLICRCF